MTDILTTDHLTKKFGGLCAVDDVSFSLEENLIMGLIGPNGAGKTTLINLVSGAIAPSQGRILFEGRDITGRKSHTINNLGVARTFQVVRIFSKLTVIENVMAALVDRRRKGPWRLVFESVAGGLAKVAGPSNNRGAAEKLLEFVGSPATGTNWPRTCPMR
jgi:branched-chain amino acid transport system ATP-binding protein